MDGGSVVRKAAGGRNPLAAGFYTVAEAARLIEGGSASRILGWLKGYSNRDVGALLHRDYAPINGRHELSFLDLIETRLVEHFRTHGVKPRALRIAAAKLREEFDTQHPFATRHVYVVADRADIFVQTMREVAAEAQDVVLRSLTSDDFVMRGIIERSLLPGLHFGDDGPLAVRWEPRPLQFPRICVDPLVAYGQPALEGGLPTSTVRDTWMAEGEDYDAAAFWLHLKAHEVRRAVEFENLLDASDVEAANA